MKLSYLPGCTLKTKAQDLDLSTVAAMGALGVELEELPRWNCCGTVFSFADDDLMHQIAPVRNLVRAQEQGGEQLVTVCSFCFNTLKRANLLVKENSDKLDTLNTFMDEEEDYKGNVNVVHLLEVLRDEVGWEQIAGKVQNPLKDLKVAAYYGCTLHRPIEAAIEPPNKPEALNDLIKAIGATPVDFPDMTTCCGSYQAVANPEIVINRTREILTSARESGAEMIAVSCPLCECNLKENQKELGELRMPVIYFTQLLALALGVDSHLHQCEQNPADARPLLESKGLIDACSATYI
ncbi:MAG: CoB--CoM heterodisulfide reductase iron-sulfur subunit B family protein [Chloroflexi bacterium]|jgi:heterodisulfide reductase subunit B2|nr:CoB--CoM heterodisulfide reductase iron-sulfur subunit B family protein [Chloroflexota bacterium]